MSQLLSWQPGEVGEAGQTLVNRAGDLLRSAGALTSIGSGLSGVWSGAAAQAAIAHHARRAGEVDELAAVVHTAGRALTRAADAISSALASLRSALAAASAAGCTVLDDGTVLPPARPPVPAGLTDEARTSWQAEADATAATQAAGATRLAQQIRAALELAGAADDTSAAALSALRPPRISPPPQPVPMGPTGGQWGPVAQQGQWWDGLSAPGPNDVLDLANGLMWPSVQRAGNAAARHHLLAVRMDQLDAVRSSLPKGAARSRANAAFFAVRAEARAANRARLTAANAFPARYVPRAALYQLNQPLSRSVPVLTKVPVLAVPLTGLGVALDRQKMSTEKAVVKNVAATAAGIGAVAVAGTIGAPVLVAVGVGAVVGYGVGLAVEHWGDDVADAATSAAESAAKTAGTAKDALGDAASEVSDTARQLWGRLGG